MVIKDLMNTFSRGKIPADATVRMFIFSADQPSAFVYDETHNELTITDDAECFKNEVMDEYSGSGESLPRLLTYVPLA